MKIDADSITAETIREIGGKAYYASMNVMRMYYEILAGETTPADAAAKLREILAPLQIEPDEPKWRYFEAEFVIWKMPAKGTGFVRTKPDGHWEPSACAIKEILADDEFPEITAEEGEP